MTDFRKAFAWTAIPIVALSIVSTAGAAYEDFYLLWFASAGVGLAAILATLIFYAKDTKERASGVLAGIGVGVLAIGITGGINFATIQAGFQ